MVVINFHIIHILFHMTKSVFCSCFLIFHFTLHFLSVPIVSTFHTLNISDPLKAGLEFQRISIDRSKMSEEEAFEHAIEMIQTRQMGFRKAADFFSVSKWKLYKTARKRGIYAEIKKQNQAQVSSSRIASIRADY